MGSLVRKADELCTCKSKHSNVSDWLSDSQKYNKFTANKYVSRKKLKLEVLESNLLLW